MDDKELLDRLEAFIKEEGPLLLWLGVGEFPAGRASGLSLLEGRLTLRQAIQNSL